MVYWLSGPGYCARAKLPPAAAGPRGQPGSARLTIADGKASTPASVEFVSRQPRRQYLELYHRIDIGLDSFPYNGHTTSLDSFWMGVPVVTLVGQTAVARAGWCQLSNLGLTESCRANPGAVRADCRGLGHDMPRHLKELRSTLRQRMQASPLMDAPRFARNIEAAYRQMWRKWCAT